jgi:hypothetical protein
MKNIKCSTQHNEWGSQLRQYTHTYTHTQKRKRKIRNRIHGIDFKGHCQTNKIKKIQPSFVCLFVCPLVGKKVELWQLFIAFGQQNLN